MKVSPNFYHSLECPEFSLCNILLVTAPPLSSAWVFSKLLNLWIPFSGYSTIERTNKLTLVKGLNDNAALTAIMKKATTCVDKHVEKLELSYFAGRVVKLHNYFVKYLRSNKEKLPWLSRLRFHASTAGNAGLISGQRTKILHAMCCGQKKVKIKFNNIKRIRKWSEGTWVGHWFYKYLFLLPSAPYLLNITVSV